jgi:DNA-binding XRE family transcriptional regulator
MKSKFHADKFAKEVKTKRVIEEDLGVTKLGNLLGISGATISRIENEVYLPDINTYAKICYWLKKPMSTFITVKNDK